MPKCGRLQDPRVFGSPPANPVLDVLDVVAFRYVGFGNSVITDAISKARSKALAKQSLIEPLVPDTNIRTAVVSKNDVHIIAHLSPSFVSWGIVRFGHQSR
jgi:hypothetical protein